MPRLVALWKKLHHQRRTATASNDAPSFPSSSIHRKIHPNLDSLVAEQRLEDPSMQSAPSCSTASNAPDFVPLKPPVRGQSYSASLHPKQMTSSPIKPQNPPEHEKLTKAAYISSSTPGDAWSTFGRGKKPSSHTKLEDIESLIATPGTTSNHETRRSARFRTPTSASQSTEASSPNSRSVQARSRYSPSSHNDVATLIMSERRSSPSSYHTFGRHTSSPYIPIEIPPPLPPLNHPAFQSRAQDLLSSDLSCTDLPERHPRHTISLPSILIPTPTRPRTTSETSKYIHGTYHEGSSSHQFHESSDKMTRVLRPIKYPKQNTANKDGRPRSKNSHGGRQSGAGYTSKQVMVVEAEVSRDLLGDSGPEADNGISLLGNPCDDNVVHLSSQTPRPGNSFLFLDTRCHILPPAGWHGDYTDFPFTHDIARSREVEGKINEMNQSDDSTHHGSNQRRAKEYSPSDTKREPQDWLKPLNRIRSTSSPSKQGGISQSATETLLAPPSFSLTSPTPETSPISSFQPVQSLGQGGSSGSQLTPRPSALKSSASRTTGKRKADEAEVETGTPSKDSRREYRATFAPDQRPHRVSENSGSSHAPSSYRRKRARLSTSSDSRPLSRSPTITSLRENLNAGNTGSWSSRTSTKGQPLTSPSHHPSRQSIQSQRLSNHSQSHRPQREPSRRRSLSGASIPISALVSPHAPSISRSATFHMHDPRKPGPIQRTSWMLSLPSQTVQGRSRWILNGWVERGGSPIHAWLFFLGFLLFPVWWLASFVGIPKTRRIGEGETEKGVVLDDPQVEYDSKSWRTRCRIMSAISFFTYIPFIILVTIFVRH